MKKCFLDSNILVYLKDDLSIYHKVASQKISKLVSSDIFLYISPLVLDECLYVFRSVLMKKKIPQFHKELHRAVAEILQLPLLLLVNPPLTSGHQLRIVEYMEEFSLKPRDAYHLLTIISNNIDSFVTFDTDFKKVFSAGLVKRE